MVDDATLVKILLKAKETGAMTNIHAENPDLIDLNIENFLKEGKTSAWYHYLSRPEFVEAEADKRAVHLAKSIGAPLYLVHMADKEGLETAIEAKEKVMIYMLKHAHNIWNLRAMFIKEKMAEILYVHHQ